MTVQIFRLSTARAHCDRMCCVASVVFECSSEKDAIETLRLRGWSVHALSKRTMCAKCAAIIAPAEA